MDIIKNALKENKLEYAIEIYAQNPDYMVKSRKFFKTYLKNYDEMHISDLSSIACIFAEDNKFQFEYNQVCAKINHILERRRP